MPPKGAKRKASEDSDKAPVASKDKAAKVEGEQQAVVAEEKKEASVTSPVVAGFLTLLQHVPETKEACLPWFQACANAILNGFELVVAGNKVFRFIEIEVYYNDHKVHTDTFIHGSDLQKATAGHWYFHTSGPSSTTYKSGTYKGLDLTFGLPGKIPGGFLLRAMEEASSGDVSEGPCVVVDRLLKENKKAAIVDLVKSPGFSLRATDVNPYMYLRPAAKPLTRVIVGSPRVGLTLKRVDDHKEHFIMMPYRFTSVSNKIKKVRQTIVLALHDQGKSVSEIVAITGATKSNAEGYVRALAEEGKKTKVPKDWNGAELKPADLTGLFAACQRAKATQ